MSRLSSAASLLTLRKAGGVFNRIQTFIELLADYPFIGARTDDLSIRRLPIPPYPYLIFYEVAGDEVLIHTVRHAARDPSTRPGSG